MTISFVRTAFVAAALLAGSLGASAAPVGAGPVSIGITIGQAPVELAQYGRYGCSPGRALRKASRLGLRRPQIVRDNRRAVVVEGRRGGRRGAVRVAQGRPPLGRHTRGAFVVDGPRGGRLVTERFAQARSCPVIAIR